MSITGNIHPKKLEFAMSPAKNSRTPASNYRKPPVAYQFKKGTSGNNDGRPPKKKLQSGLSGSGGGIADRLVTMALDEAIRPVTVREGDKVSEIPAMQALIRTMFRAAAQGDTKAGRQLLEMVARAESGRTGTAVEMLQFAHQYKEKYGPIFEQCEREGLDPPNIFPHPDDFITDGITGDVTIDGPTSKEEAGARKALVQKAIDTMLRYFEVEGALKKDPKNSALRQEFKQLKLYHDVFLEDGNRNIRHEALRLSRLALETKPPKPNTAKRGPKA
jgi:hypothetical protein